MQVFTLPFSDIEIMQDVVNVLSLFAIIVPWQGAPSWSISPSSNRCTVNEFPNASRRVYIIMKDDCFVLHTIFILNIISTINLEYCQ